MTTTDFAEAAERLARAIVEERLAACVQVLPVRSFFRWDGAAQEEPEVLLLIKTRQCLCRLRLEAFLKERHSYDTPEIVAFPIVAGSHEYLDWIAAETS